MANPYIGFKSLLKKAAATIAAVEQISWSGLKRDFIDTTTMDNANSFKTALAALAEAGEIKFDILWDPADTTHKALTTDLIAGTSASYSVTWSDTGASVWSCTAYVAGFEPKAPHDNKLSASVTLKLTGAPTIPA